MTTNVLVDGSLPPAAAANGVGRKSTSDASNGLEMSLLPRSASYTQLPATTMLHATPESNGIKRTFSENVLANPGRTAFRQSFSKHASEGAEQIHGRLNGKSLLRRRSARSLVGPKITVSKFALGPHRDTSSSAYDSSDGTSKENLDPEIKRRPVSGSLTSFARKSWMSASRSPSPNKREAPPDGVSGSNSAKPMSKSGAVTRSDSENTVVNDHIGTPAKRSSTVIKKSRRPLSAFLGRASPESGAPSLPSIPKSYSTDRLPSLNYNYSSSDKPPIVPKSISFERLQGTGTESPRRKDELWGVFRALDGDFQK